MILYSDEGERGTESIGLTQEIDLAVEQAMLSGVGTPEYIGGAGEEFPPENLKGWEMNTAPGTFSVSCDVLVKYGL